MTYSGYELLWLFFVYSFIGWVVETSIASGRQRRLVDKGGINLPFCMLYGMAAVFITVFGSELQGIWLYMGSVLMITIFKWFSGRMIERIYHEKWWDYSDTFWNFGGYASISNSAFLGIFAIIMMKWGNQFFIHIFGKIPYIVQNILIWGLVILFVTDSVAILCIPRVKEHKTKLLHVGAKKVEQIFNTDEVFAAGCSFYKIIWLFFIGAFLGDVVETIFCRVTAGVWMSRSSVVWGPFSIVWGVAIAAATVLLYQYKDRSDRALFFAGTFWGGAYEYVCSVFTELVFGKVFWDYSHIRFNLGGRINLLFCFFWGIAAVIWIKGMYPYISVWIEKIPVKPGKIISWGLILFMCCNITVSSMALLRSGQREEGIEATYKWQKIMDARFDDNRLKEIYPKAVNVD